MMRQTFLVGCVAMMLALASCSKSGSSSEKADKGGAAGTVAVVENALGTELGAWLNEQQAKLPVGEMASVSLVVKDADTVIFATSNVSKSDLATEWPMISPDAIAKIVEKMQSEEEPLLFLLCKDAVLGVVKLKSEAALEGSYCKGWAVENGEATVTVMKSKLPFAPFVALQFQ